MGSPRPDAHTSPTANAEKDSELAAAAAELDSSICNCDDTDRCHECSTHFSQRVRERQGVNKP